MIRRATAALTAALVLSGGCTSPSDVEMAASALDARFLDPLADADISATVERRCRLGNASGSEPWHLETRISVDADRDRVADTLAAEGIVLVRDREPAVVQQEPGEPAAGWNGSLARSGDGALLGLTFNNVEPGDPAGAWGEVCPTG